ncbi:MAG: hypothetical protein NT034_04720 [Candidatus Magasanikbacteria bacterium]|nr:hypothetical protein [Candidatus Magasanikbacteria bacterium]
MNDKNLDNLNEEFARSRDLRVQDQAEQEQKSENEKTENTPAQDKKRVEAGTARRAAPLAVKKNHRPVPQMQDPTVLKIEKILENGLADQYVTLSPIAKQEFKIKGEETAIKIKELLQDTHIKVKKILQLIIEWMKILPGLNRFFLEQEAKIKTDSLVELHKIQQEKHSDKLL